MKISICTTTARKGFVAEQARMIAAQDYPIDNLEWILVDFAYEFRAKELYDLSKEIGLTIKHVPNVRDNQLLFRDITRNRNKALANATGDAVIFLDDYAVIDRNFVQEHVKVLSQMKISAGRMFRLPSLETETISEFVARGACDYNSIMLSVNREKLGKDFRDRGDNVVYQVVAETYTGNLGIPRTIFEHLNGFDPRMESALEDCDLGVRAYMAGFGAVYNPMASTINLSTEGLPYVTQFDHAHDVEPFICNGNNHFAGDAKLTENEHMKISFYPSHRVATCKICSASGMIDPNELMTYKNATKEFRVPSGLAGGLDSF